MTNTTQGFTLIELLIVIAIIGILAAVLLPNLLGAQKRAYDVAALGCANSLAKAVAMWKVDNTTNVAVPDAATLIADADKGAGKCADTSLTVKTVKSGGPDWQFSVKHAQGKNTYTVSDAGISNS